MRAIHRLNLFTTAMVVFFAAAPASAVPLLAVGDFCIGIDLDAARSASRYNFGERASMALDSNTGTKYLNFGEENSGYIVTTGLSIAQSLRLTTANDAEVRDPATYEIYGTNDAITSGLNSLGDSENWTLISAGPLTLPVARQTAAPLVSFVNATQYTSYKVLFPTVKNAASANSMQISESHLFSDLAGTVGIDAAGNPILPIDATILVGSESPAGTNEDAFRVLDGVTTTKYLNFGRENSGIIVTPVQGPKSIVQSMVISTANDAPERDPTSYALYGTNEAIISPEDSQGDFENWTLISSGAISLPLTRQALGPTVLINAVDAYSSYRLVFPTVRNTNANGDLVGANSMQISNVQFEALLVPEPGTLVLALVGLAGMALLGRRRVHGR